MSASLEKMIKNILLVEDDKASQILMRQAFKAAGSESVLNVAASGEEAMEFLRQQGRFENAAVPEVVLLDLNLPGKSGLQLLKEIKESPALRHLPVIVLTGSNASSDIRECAKFPHCRYLLKPSRFHELIELVKSIPQLI